HGSAGIVLHDEAVELLRSRLRSSPELLQKCWNLTKHIHQDGSQAILYEEELSYLTLLGLDDPANAQRATSILRDLLVSFRRARLGLWSVRAMLRLPRKLIETIPEARMLAIGVARSSGNELIWAKLPSGTGPDIYSWLGTDVTKRSPI